MRILPLIIFALYLLPPIGLLLYGASVGTVDDLMSFISILARGLLVALATVALGIGVSGKIKFLQCDGVRFYARFYAIYMVAFFVLNLWLGFEIVHSDPNEPWHHP